MLLKEILEDHCFILEACNRDNYSILLCFIGAQQSVNSELRICSSTLMDWEFTVMPV